MLHIAAMYTSSGFHRIVPLRDALPFLRSDLGEGAGDLFISKAQV